MKRNAHGTAVLTQHNPDILTVYLAYRAVLCVVLLGMFFISTSNNVVGSHYPELFKWTAIFYALFCFGSLFVFKAEQLVHSVNRITFLLIVDILALTILIHASGGIESGMAYLLVILAAMSSVFLTGTLALGLAAFITLFILGETIYLTKNTNSFSNSLFAAGTLSTLVFVSTILFQYLTAKIRKTAAVAERHSKDAENLQRIGQDIIKRMQTGIIVIDKHDRLSLINQSAMRMLSLSSKVNFYGESLDKFPTLKNVLDNWRHNPAKGIPLINKLTAGQEVRINFAELKDTDDQAQTILYMEDNRAMTQHAQQLKLASLGRLTASIAHEIRNPLGAIAHASQLLKESTELPAADLRLTEIILQHSDRVNHIIENTLSLSRRKEAKPETLHLCKWVEKFTDEYKTSNKGTVDIHYSPADESLKIKMDPIHFQQVLTNLFDNGLRHSKEHTGEARIDVHIAYNETRDKNYIEVIDFGLGIPEDQVEQVFEPFYTTAEKGSGLGLFISQELCEINQSSLHYIRTKAGLSCFRIEFSHYQRIT